MRGFDSSLRHARYLQSLWRVGPLLAVGLRAGAQGLLCDVQTLLARGVLLDLPAAVAAAAELQPIPAPAEVQAQVRHFPNHSNKRATNLVHTYTPTRTLYLSPPFRFRRWRSWCGNWSTLLNHWHVRNLSARHESR